MYAKPSDNFEMLSKDERRLVWFARQANHDTWGGGCQSLVWAERQGNRDAERVVSKVYSLSSGKVPDDLDAFECGECGQVYYGRDAAEQCCVPDESGDDDMDWMSDEDGAEAQATYDEAWPPPIELPEF